MRVANPLDKEGHGTIGRFGMLDDFFDFVFDLIICGVFGNQGFLNDVWILRDELIRIARNVFSQLGDMENGMDTRLGR